MKICPKCQRTWPSGGRFCPMDGSALEDVKAQQVDTDKPTIVLPAYPAAPPAKAAPPAPAPVAPPAPVTPPVPASPPAPAAKADVPPPAAKPTPRPTQATKARRTQAVPAVKAPADPKPKKGEFSETKWFMAGELVKEDEIPPEAYPVQQLEPRYRKTGELPADVRKKFSLTKDDADAPKKD